MGITAQWDGAELLAPNTSLVSTLPARWSLPADLALSSLSRHLRILIPSFRLESEVPVARTPPFKSIGGRLLLGLPTQLPTLSM